MATPVDGGEHEFRAGRRTLEHCRERVEVACRVGLERDDEGVFPGVPKCSGKAGAEGGTGPLVSIESHELERKGDVVGTRLAQERLEELRRPLET